MNRKRMHNLQISGREKKPKEQRQKNSKEIKEIAERMKNKTA